jgi:hypothetical protein
VINHAKEAHVVAMAVAVAVAEALKRFKNMFTKKAIKMQTM